MSGWNKEWMYVYLERLGMMVGDDVPTIAQVNEAKRLADEHVKQLEALEELDEPSNDED